MFGLLPKKISQNFALRNEIITENAVQSTRLSLTITINHYMASHPRCLRAKPSSSNIGKSGAVLFAMETSFKLRPSSSAKHTNTPAETSAHLLDAAAQLQ